MENKLINSVVFELNNGLTLMVQIEEDSKSIVTNYYIQMKNGDFKKFYSLYLSTPPKEYIE